ncbi:hypothetical protein CALVIDRAFT_486538 [Calocera viscosa TUFC12733]|uniref:CxC5 like cysteine cluster associated with KDZ domain-containing protein n=1 Tax=Calocera viscosa (strain TUFC12733) TaxID=1330018 RepID=A0A167IVZ5_CALVF|nr:hypothetical protein CALVIDRAFT_486538 [Calocera viscosa TUFC12733]
MGLARRLQNRISWHELVALHNLDESPPGLPYSVLSFLASALGVSPTQVRALWDVFRDILWVKSRDVTAVSPPLIDDYGPFAESPEEFYPPTRTCLNTVCPYVLRTGHQQRLYDPRRHLAALYTLARGAIPVIITSLRCRACGSTYHLNYFSQADANGMEWRVYYQGVPTIVRVRAHALFKDKLCQLFRALTVHSHSSMMATSRVYNSTLSSGNPRGWQAPHLQPRDIANLFDLYALLLHHHEQRTRLRLPDSAPN